MKYCVLFGIAAFISISGILTVSLIYSLTGGVIPFDYGIAVDAGSTHTSFILYKWEGDKDRGTGIAQEIDSCDLGALSDLNPEQVDSVFRPCYNNITMNIPKEKISETELFLGATAGMRLLNISNHYLNEAILIAVNCSLSTSGLKLKRAGILSGQDEGLYGWITANFLTKTIQSAKVVPTLGALDLGGASTQIAFSVPDSTTGQALPLFGRNHSVESISYLCYGAKEIHRRHFALLVDDLDSNETWTDPCNPIGLVMNMSATELLDKPCTRTEKHVEWLFKHRHELVGKYFYFNGSSDSEQCAEKISSLLDEENCRKNFTNCYQPIPAPMDQTFMAFSSYYYTANFINAKNVSLQDYRIAKDHICGLNWTELEKLKPTVPKTPWSFMYQVCFQAHLVDLILTDEGYGFNETSWKNIQFVEKLNGASVGWALGYMVAATNAIPAEDPTAAWLSLPIMIVLMIICLSILGAAGFFLRKSKIRSTSLQSNYLSV